MNDYLSRYPKDFEKRFENICKNLIILKRLYKRKIKQNFIICVYIPRLWELFYLL